MLHTSDVHLESDSFGPGENGRKMALAMRRNFAEVITIANREQVDLTLIVGDLFDSSRVTEEALGFAMGEIARAMMPVVMIPGNHDAHDERSIYSRLSPDELPANLHLILEPEGKRIDFPELSTRVWGRALVEHSPEYRPLFGIPPASPAVWNIALAHGLFTESDEGVRSSPITAADIAATNYDYIALGHVHVFSDVSQGSTRAFYCGTPGPMYSSADSGWVARVTCEPDGQVRVERLAVIS
ncbi:MAG TPA: DNA repair exonuclease [Candidatus Binataceae bacterium]|nr:DNA repair exonuclease [Candidatus Binataceae bacterium]